MKIDTLDKEGYRKFGLTMASCIALFFGLFFPWIFNKDIPTWPWMVSIIFLLLALLIPMKLVFIHKPWMIIGHIIGTINTQILLSMVYLLLFTPLALLFKALGKDPMNRHFGDKSVTSYWKKSKKQSKDHMEKVF